MHGRVLERAQRFAFSLAMAAAMGITAYLFWKKHTQIRMPSHLSTSDPGKKERKSGKPKQSAERERQRQRQRQHKKRQRKRKKFRQEFIKDGTIRSLLGGEEEEGVELGGVAKQDGSLRTLPKGHRNFDMKLAKQALGKISWQKCPKSADPGGEYKEKTSRWISDTMGGLPPARAARKRCQIECIAAVLHKVLQHLNNSNNAKQKYTIVDFGAGSGNVGLALAWLFPHHDFVLVDNRERAVDLAWKRAQNAKLPNVSCVSCDIREYSDDFDIGMAIHACGAATDFAQIQCLRSRTPYILCPCCIGKLRKLAHPLPLDDTKKKKRPTHPPPVSLSAEFVLSHPRSLWMRGKISRERYARLARLADFHGFEGGSMEKAGDKGRGEEQMMREYIRYRRVCKSVLECDRNQAAIEAKGYVVFHGRLEPHTCSTKIDILVGMPPESH